MPQYLPAGLTQYVFNSYLTKAPPYHVTTDDVTEQALRVAVSYLWPSDYPRPRTEHRCHVEAI